MIGGPVVHLAWSIAPRLEALPIEAGVPMRRGDYFAEVANQPSRGEVAGMRAGVVRERRPNWCHGMPLVEHVKHVTELERVALALGGDGATVDMLIGMTLFCGEDARGLLRVRRPPKPSPQPKGQVARCNMRAPLDARKINDRHRGWCLGKWAPTRHLFVGRGR